MVWSEQIDSSGREMEKIYALVVPYTRGKGVDIGSGAYKWFGHWITIDSGQDYGGKRVADIMQDGTAPLPFGSDQLDFVVSSHFIEHVAEWDKALAEWWRVVKPGGHLVLYWPHPDYYPKVGERGANPDHKVDLYPHDVVRCMRKLGGWDLVENETRTQDNEYSQFQVWRKRADAKQNVSPWSRAPQSCLVIRYGAFGDLLQASSVIAGLKAQGYHITLNTTPKGQSVTLHDPNIDAFIIQDENQVPNENLGPYWTEIARRYDRCVNLCESVEGTLLTLPHSLHDKHSQGARHRLYNRNYLEKQHDIAELPSEPYEFKPAFFPTRAEEDFVAKVLKELPKPHVLWVLGGSSVHKVYPHVPPVVARLLGKFEGSIIFAGEKKHQEIEIMIQDSCKLFVGDASRLVRTCGLWPIRGTLALAQKVDLVVGPETGVLNAVSHTDVPKVVFLSHSSPENLTKHWRNVVPLVPVKGSTPCWPCHQLHYDWARCNRHEATGAALCQFNITVEMALEGIMSALAMPRDAKAQVEPSGAGLTDPDVDTTGVMQAVGAMLQDAAQDDATAAEAAE